MNERSLRRLLPPSSRIAALAFAALLGGCAVYTPYPGYYGYPAYAGAYPAYVAPPVVGGVYVGGGWGWHRGHRYWR